MTSLPGRCTKELRALLHFPTEVSRVERSRKVEQERQHLRVAQAERDDSDERRACLLLPVGTRERLPRVSAGIQERAHDPIERLIRVTCNKITL